MAFIKLADLGGELELILFPNAYQQTIGMWQRDNVLIVSGKISTKDRTGNNGDEVKILVDDAREVTAEQASGYLASGKKPKKPKPSQKKVPNTKLDQSNNSEKRIYIRLANTEDHAKLTILKTLIDEKIGSTSVVLVVGDEVEKKAIKLPHLVDPDKALLKELESIFGETAVKYQ